MSVKKNNNSAVKELENKLKKAQMLNYILIAVCAVLIIACIVISISSCGSGKGTDLPLVDTVSGSDSAETCPFAGTYQYVSADDTYGFAMEFTSEGAVWFYEATKDETVVQGFVGELISNASSSDIGYTIPLSKVDFTPYTTASVELELTENGNLRLTQTNSDAVLSAYIPVGSAVTLYPVENYSLSQAIIALYADEMTE